MWGCGWRRARPPNPLKGEFWNYIFFYFVTLHINIKRGANMYSEARKIHLIEEVLKVKSDAVLIEIETILKSHNDIAEKKSSIYDFVGIISKDEANEMTQAIAETCEIIDENDWK
jgi:hypothetical protein